MSWSGREGFDPGFPGALAARGRGRHDRELPGELERLRGEAERVGPRVALPAIEVALAEHAFR